MSVTAAPAFKSLQKSSQRECIILLAKPKEGKTTCALTASAKFNWGDAPTLVDDIGIISLDATGMSSMRMAGWEFSYWIDLSDYLTLPMAKFDDVLKASLAKMGEVAAEKKIHTLVVDPISTLDVVWHGELAKFHEKWALSAQLNIRHMNFLTKQLMPLPCNLVLPCHTKTLSEGMTADKKESVGLDPEDRVVMDVGGWDGPKTYRSQASAILPLKRARGQKGAPDEFYLYPKGISGMEAGSRYESQFAAYEKIPANLKDVFSIMKTGKLTDRGAAMLAASRK